MYAATKEGLQYLLGIVKSFSDDIRMKFGLDKCETVSLRRGKLKDVNYQLDDGRQVKTMLAGDTYKYLGIKQARRIEHSQMKRELEEEYTKRIRKILASGLNGKNTVKAINTFAVPVLGNSFGIVQWIQWSVLMTKYR